MIAEVKKKYSLSNSEIARQLGLGYTTLMRWKRRLSKGQPPVEKPGPKKVTPLDLGQLRQKIQDIEHGGKRSRGTARLHSVFKDAISRRELDQMIASVRNESNRQRSSQTCHITWLRPNLAWAMDDCQSPGTVAVGKLHLHNLSDLCSRYKFRPLASSQLPCGEDVAGHLSHLFSRFGPPLFCKRDNGGNLNHTAVDDVLADALVVPINNPVSTASYNGAIEHTQGEFKTYLRRLGLKAESGSEIVLLAETAAHDLNHRPRRSLKGLNACRTYFGGTRLRYSKRERQEVYRWIRELAVAISIGAGKDTILPAAWRAAAKKWLVKNGMIRIQMAGKVLPDFPSKLCHN
jgi:transposase-like protein